MIWIKCESARSHSVPYWKFFFFKTCYKDTVFPVKVHCDAATVPWKLRIVHILVQPTLPTKETEGSILVFFKANYKKKQENSTSLGKKLAKNALFLYTFIQTSVKWWLIVEKCVAYFIYIFLNYARELLNLQSSWTRNL